MTPSDVQQIIGALQNSNSKLADKTCLLTENLTLSAIAQNLPFTGIDYDDVGSVIIKVKKTGSPTDDTYLLRYTQAIGATPTASEGMWMGHGDLFEISNNCNVKSFKVIATTAFFGELTIEYYGK